MTKSRSCPEWDGKNHILLSVVFRLWLDEPNRARQLWRNNNVSLISTSTLDRICTKYPLLAEPLLRFVKEFSSEFGADQIVRQTKRTARYVNPRRHIALTTAMFGTSYSETVRLDSSAAKNPHRDDQRNGAWYRDRQLDAILKIADF